MKPRPPKPAAAVSTPQTKADKELAYRLFGKMRLTCRHGLLCELHEDGQATEIMGLPDIELQAKLGYEVKVNGMVEYTFALSRPTDLAWRSLFLDQFTRPQVVFADTRLKVACLPEDIAPVLARLRATAAATNTRYGGIWESVRALAREQDQARDEEAAREQARAELVRKSFEQLDMPLAKVKLGE